MGDPDLLRITGLTPEREQFMRDVCAWPAVPDLGRVIHVNCGPNFPMQGGSTGFSFPDDFNPDPNYSATPFLHEYGHVWDYHWLSTEDRQAILALHNIDIEWFDKGKYNEQPVERFAGTFSKIMMESEGYSVNVPYESLEPMFTDIGDLSQESQDAIVWMYQEGITKGTTITTYGPGEFVTREQMALFFQRAFE